MMSGETQYHEQLEAELVKLCPQGKSVAAQLRLSGIIISIVDTYWTAAM